MVVPLVDGVAGALLLLNDEAHNTTSPQARVDVHRCSIDWFQDVGPERKRSVYSWFGVFCIVHFQYACLDGAVVCMFV